MSQFQVQRTGTLQEPKVEITYSGVGRVDVKLTYACGSCGGYGSPCRSCSGGRIVEDHTPETLLTKLGPGIYDDIFRTVTQGLNPEHFHQAPR